MSEDLDRIRQKIGIDKLETQQRKKLFHDFVEHGGQIIEEKKTARGIIPRSTVQKDRKTEEKGRFPTPQKVTQKQPPSSVKTFLRKHKRKKRVRIRDRARIYLRGLILKVFTPYGKRLSEHFLHFMHRQVKQALLDLYMSTNSFLKGEASIKKEIHRLSVAENSTFYEFLVRLNFLYEEKEFGKILNFVSQRVVPGTAYLDSFKAFFKRLYILGQHSDLCKLYTDKSIDIKLMKKMIDPDLAPSLKVQLKKDINIILGELLVKTHILLCRIDKTYYPLYSQALDDFLGMTEQDKIGFITQEERKKRLEELKRQKEYLKMQQRVASQKEEEEVKPPKHVERGFPLLESVLEKAENAIGSESGPISLIKKNDKMFRSIFLFDEFDNQYSFILTTGKITFNIDYRDQKKIDTKDDLNKAYLLMCEAREEVKNYINIIQEIQKTNDNLRYTIHERELTLDSLEKGRSVASRKARRKLAEVMKTVETAISVVISDYNASKRLLQNPDTVLYFDRNIDGIKNLHGKKIIEAIIEAFLFASSFAFLLNYGQLSGSGLYIEPEEQKEPNP